MKFEFLKALMYFAFHKHRFSKASLIGPASFEEYMKFLGRVNVVVSEDSHCKRIQWEDVCTLYVFRFSLKGEFQQVEREIWYEYQWPSFKKMVLMDAIRK
jgi:hypothetical protein